MIVMILFHSCIFQITFIYYLCNIMVAMGTSLADRAWGSESAVYSCWVLNVIGGWFFTAFIAFGLWNIAFLINLGGPTAIAILLFVALLLLARNYISHRKETAQIKNEDALSSAKSSSIQELF